MNTDKNSAFIILGLILLISVVYMVQPFIGSLSLAIFLYYGCVPIYNHLRKRGFSKNISAIASELSLVLPVIIVMTYTFRIISIELRVLSVELRSIVGAYNTSLYTDLAQIPYIIEILNNYGSSDIKTPEDALEFVQSIDLNYLISVADISFNTIINIVSTLGDLFFILTVAFIVSYYLLINKDEIEDLCYDILNHNKDTITFLQKLNKKLKFVFIGNLGLIVITSLISIIVYSFVYLILPEGHTIQYPILISLLCGITSVIPAIGAKLSYIPVTIILYINSLIEYTGLNDLILPTSFLILSFIFIDAIPDFIIRPKISSIGGSYVGVVLVSFIFGPIVFGWYGLFLGPVILVTAHEFVKEILPKLSNGTI